MKINNKILTLALLVMVGCSGYEPEVSVGPGDGLNTEEVLQANDYSILVDALNRSGIQLEAGNTLLAPNNTAFQAAFTQLGVSSLDDVDDATLVSILRYHLIPEEVLSSDLATGEVNTDLGQVINIVVGDNITINAKATVVDANRVSTEGVIHGINQVLLPPSGNLLEVINNDENFETLAAAIAAAGLESTFSGTTNYTVFAPTDDAFAANGYNAGNIGTIPAAALANILSFHVVAGKTFSIQLPESGKIATILGTEENGQEELILDGTEIKSYYAGAAQTASANIESVNLLATNGVIHGLDDMLFELGTLFDFMDPNTNSPRTGGDNSAPNALDNMGTIIEGLNYTRLLSLTDTSTVFIPLGAPDYASFVDDAEALEFLENHTFEGKVNFAATSNGSRVTSVNGSEFYIAKDADGFPYVNGNATNIVDAGFLYDFYNGDAYRYSSVFEPIPETGVLEALNDEGYTKFAAIIEVLELEDALNSGNNTIFAISDGKVDTLFNEVFEVPFASALTASQIAALTSEGALGFLQELALNHVATGANFSIYYNDVLPTLSALSTAELSIAETVKVKSEMGNTVVTPIIAIILDEDNVVESAVEIFDQDIIYSNGVIQRVDGYILFD